MKRLFFISILLLSSAFFFKAFSQEALKSTEEEYYDMLSLSGLVKRSFLNYRTLSDSKWVFNEDVTMDVESSESELFHPWENINLGTTYTLFTLEKEKLNFYERGVNNSITLKIYGPEWYNSYNTDAPWGGNDGALWQGRGYNTSFTAGVRAEMFGFDLTCKPQVSFSQNKEFEIMKSKIGNGYGYFWGACDAPQRFGDSSFWTYDWGDTELRYSWHAFTVGVGTESIWLGPAHENALLYSNNAATFPKIDFGLKRTEVIIPIPKPKHTIQQFKLPKSDRNFDFYNLDIGELEMRMWVGKLKESDYFDTNPDNDDRQLSGWTISYSPSFLKGLTLGFNKTLMCYWADKYWYYYLNPFYKGNVVNTNEAKQGEDQKASFTVEWLFEENQFDFYSEIGVDDYTSKGLKIYEYARFPFHTMTYTVGIKKGIDYKDKRFHGLLNFEWNCTEASQDYQMWPNSGYNFGFHGQIRQGWTNKGQWLGSSIGYGGNNQYLSYTLFTPFGYEKLFVGRNNPDNNYIWAKCVEGSTAYTSIHYFTAFKANLYVGLESLWYVIPDLSLKASFMYDLLINPLYNPGLSDNGAYREYTYINNFVFGFTAKYRF